MKQYDIVIVGAGITGAVIASQFKDKNVLILERKLIGGQTRTENYNGIEVYKHGLNILHTSNPAVWDLVNKYDVFKTYVHRSKASVEDVIYPYPINLSTYNELYQIESPEAVNNMLTPDDTHQDYESYMYAKAGWDLYDKFFKGYIEKMWGVPGRNLPAFLAKNTPIRTSYDDIQFKDRWQGIPMNGYTYVIEEMTKHCDILNVDFLSDKEYYESLADIIVYTGSVDEYFDYSLGELPYRTLIHNLNIEPVDDYQGIAEVIYCDEDDKMLRSIEHKHLDYNETKTTIVSEEYAKWWSGNKHLLRMYPMPIEDANYLYESYARLDHKAYFAGVIGTYKNMEIDECIENALALTETIKEELT